MTFNSLSEEATKDLGETIGRRLKGGEILALISDLGGGKTTFVKGLAKGAGIKEPVSSPSFTITNEYLAKSFTIYHYDFYRLNDPGIIKRQLAEVIKDTKAVTVIEWPTVIKNILPDKKISFEFQAQDENTRIIKINCPRSLKYLVKDLK